MKFLAREFNEFLLAIQFLTILPTVITPDYSTEELNKSGKYFPLVGIIIGTIGFLAFQFINIIFEFKLLAILVSMITTILVTGAFHEDGFTDFCDGYGGGFGDKEKIISIMRDSRIGAFGTIGIFLLLSLKLILLERVETSLLFLVILLGHSLSRFNAIAFLVTDIYASTTGKSKPMANQLTFIELIFASLPILVLFYFLPKSFILTLVAIVIVHLVFRFHYFKITKGFTGDGLGAVQQVSEVMIYFTVLGVSKWKFIY
ncbi:MAG: adenosylcobinamide-GDP ribazoletransferase [Leptospiraceae bacterium]|nr:adenosylcobinamide-GDP ribazoletransferase [Leptospiraceae bacterium]